MGICLRNIVQDMTYICIDINGGRKILIRLRPAHAPDSFYPEEDIIGTMLHEVGFPRTSLPWTYVHAFDCIVDTQRPRAT